ncbi:MAG: hypothetical protein IJE43_19085 [Alphaproteobacteria bacterium]|nr:hypothetical protein [Alphaproteobacteria bacterium]
MAEDISAQARTGVTVMALAALLAVALNVMVIAQSIVSTGMGTLQSGVESIKKQEYELYNNTRVTGVQVKTALTLYTTRENAVVIGTKNSLADNKYYVYGALLADTQSPTSSPYIAVSTFDAAAHREAGAPHFVFDYLTDSYMSIQHFDDTRGTILNGSDTFIEESATFEAQLIKNKTNTIVGIRFKQVN